MRNLKSFLLAFAAFALAGNVSAQSVYITGGLGVSDAISAVSTDIGIYIKYVGATQTGTATVAVDAATGDLAFVVNGGADTTIGCPTATGTIDTSDAACDTMGEVLDVINKTTNWRAVLGGMIRSDSSNNTLITRSAAVASGPEGLALLKDTAVALNITLDLTPNFTPSTQGRSMGFFFGESPAGSSAKLIPNAFDGLRTLVTNIRENITSGGTIGQFVVYGVKQTHTALGSTSYVNKETVRTIWSETGAATTVQLIPGPFNAFPLYGAYGERVLVRISAGTNLTVPLVNAAGVLQKYSQQTQ